MLPLATTSPCHCILFSNRAVLSSAWHSAISSCTKSTLCISVYHGKTASLSGHDEVLAAASDCGRDADGRSLFGHLCINAHIHQKGKSASLDGRMAHRRYLIGAVSARVLCDGPLPRVHLLEIRQGMARGPLLYCIVHVCKVERQETDENGSTLWPCLSSWCSITRRFGITLNCLIRAHLPRGSVRGWYRISGQMQS